MMRRRREGVPVILHASNPGSWRGPFAHRDFTLFWIGDALSGLGTALVPVALSFALFDGGSGAVQLGAVLAAQMLPMVALMLLGGVFADRLAPRRTMIVADLLRAVAQTALASLLLTDRMWLPAILVLVGLLGVGTALGTPGRNRLLTQIVPAERLESANGSLMVASSMAGLFARQAHGAARWGGLLSAMGAGAALGALLALRLRPRRPIRAMLLWMLLYPPGPISLAAGLPYSVQLGCFALGGMEMAQINVLWESTLQREIPADRLSRVSAYDAFGSFCLMPLGYGLAAPLGLLLGIPGALATGGVLVLLSTLWLLCLPDIRNAGRRH